MIHNAAVFDALDNLYRRQLLVALLTTRVKTIPVLPDSARELADSDSGLFHKHLENVKTDLTEDPSLLRVYYIHLPKLDADEFIAWDRDAHSVERGARFDELRPILDVLADSHSGAPEPSVSITPPKK